MRNKISSIILILSLVLLVVALFYGINIKKLQILSIAQIKEKNSGLNEKIDKASSLATIDYTENVEKLSKTFDEYVTTKEKYEQISNISSQDELDEYETKQYDISYLWKVLGDYAESRNLILGIEVQKSTTNSTLYSFKFSVSGEYTNIIQFIKDLENDSDLYFRIYDFTISGSGVTLNASFKVENINIDQTTIKNSQSSTSNLFEEKK